MGANDISLVYAGTHMEKIQEGKGGGREGGEGCCC